MSELREVTELISEKFAEQQALSNEQIDEQVETNFNLAVIAKLLSDDINMRREDRRSERDDKLDSAFTSTSSSKPSAPKKGILPSNLKNLGADSLLAALTGLTTGAIGGILALLTRWEQKKDELNEAIQGTLTKITGLLAAPTILPLLKNIAGVAKNIAGTMFGWVGDLGKAIATEFRLLRAQGFKLKQPFRFIKGAFNSFGKFVSGTFRAIGSTLKGIMKLAKPFLATFKFIGGIIGRISGIFTIVIALFDGIIGTWRAFESGVRSPVKLIRVFLESAINGFLSLIGDVGQVVGWLAKKFLTFIGVSEEAADKVKGAVVWAFDKIEWALTSLVSLTLGAFEWVVNKIVGIGELVPGLIAGVPGAIGAAWNGVIKGFELAVAGVENVINGVSSVVSGARKIIGNIFGGLKRAKDRIKGDAIRAREAFKKLLDGVRKRVNEVRESIKNALGWVRKKLKGAKEALVGTTKEDEYTRVPSMGFGGGSGPVSGVRPTDRGMVASSQRVAGASKSIEEGKIARATIVSAPSVSSRTANVAVSNQSSMMVVPPSAHNRSDPFTGR